MRSEKSNIALTYIDIPTKCPVCGGDTYIQDDILYCGNPHCDGKFVNLLCHFVGKKGLDIKGLSKATLEKLINWNWINNLHDLFTLELHRIEWIDKDGFGIKSVDNILNAIQNARDCELWQFISALSIPLIGSTYAKEIAKRCATWEEFRNIKDFYMWDSFGPEMHYSLKEYNYTEADELVANVLYLKNSLYNNCIVAESQLTGKTICITGKLNHYSNRDELIKVIEAAGGKVTSSVSKKTNYLVTNDTTSGSSKNVKAQALNIPIISEEQLLEML